MDQTPSQKEFYSPLCQNGYLTPLQRLKLREKRKLDSSFISEDTMLTQLKKVKKSTEKRSCRKKKKSVLPKQYLTPKLYLKEAEVARDDNKKFFKTSPLSRLEKASFSMMFPFKNNLKSSPKTKQSTNNESVSKNQKVVSKSYFLEQSSPCVTDSSVHNDHVSSDVQIHLDGTKLFEMKDNVFDFAWPSDAILLQRQEKARSYQRESILELNVSQPSVAVPKISPKKLYPIFDVNSHGKPKNSALNDTGLRSKSLKISSNGSDQLIIDAGQTKFGPKICPTCNMLYSPGHEEDEKLHSSYHCMFLLNLKFPGWKTENVIGEYPDGRVVMVKMEDPSFKVKKIEDVLKIANKDLGSPDSLPEKPGLVFLIFVSNEKCVAGCLVAEPISKGHKIVFSNSENSDSVLPNCKTLENGRCYSSVESFPAVCGINRIWVSKNYRRCKIASRMLDCLRCNFIHGHVVDKQEIAFLDPAIDGRKLAASYLETNSFLVYK